jgi:hypothetical protein
MTETTETTAATRGHEVLQLRVVLAGISPMIWRRLLVPAWISIAELHQVLQRCFGWEGDRLHRFVIHGGEYGISYEGGVGYPQNPHQLQLGRFGLRPTERFTYEYDFIAGWRVQLRVEAILCPTHRHSVCVAGRRSGPPPRCYGVLEYLRFRARYNIITVAIRLMELIEDPEQRQDNIAEIRAIRDWLGLDRFDRRALNRSLAQITTRRSPV